MSAYPPLVLPPLLAAKPFQSWTHSDATAYKDWVAQQQPDRIRGLLSYLGDDGAGSAEDLLGRVEARVRAIVSSPEFSESSAGAPTSVTKGGRTYSLPAPVRVRLTGRGRVLAMDLGLLLAHLLIAGANRPLAWDVVTDNRNDVSFHCPVLVGFGGDHAAIPYDPILIATNALIAELNRRRGPRLVELFRGMSALTQ